MGVIDRLQGEAVLPHIFDGLKHFLGIHDKGDLGTLFRRKARKMPDFRLVKRGALCRPIQAHDVLDAVNSIDRLPGSGKKAAALLRIELARVNNEFGNDLSGNNEV